LIGLDPHRPLLLHPDQKAGRAPALEQGLGGLPAGHAGSSGAKAKVQSGVDPAALAGVLCALAMSLVEGKLIEVPTDGGAPPIFVEDPGARVFKSTSENVARSARASCWDVVLQRAQAAQQRLRAQERGPACLDSWLAQLPRPAPAPSPEAPQAPGAAAPKAAGKRPAAFGAPRNVRPRVACKWFMIGQCWDGDKDASDAVLAEDACEINMALAAALLAVFAVAGAVEEGKWGWIDVDSTNVDKVLQEGPILVKFFAPWCSHCKSMAKDFHKLAQEELPDGIRVGRVDSTKNPALNKRFGIHGYPTLLMLTDEGKDMRSYAGDRSFQSLLSFAKGGWRTAPVHDPTKPRAKKSWTEQLHALPWTVKAVGLLFVVGLPLSIFAACYDVYVERKRRDARRAERKATAGKAD
ncbi:unnamed protein product, partial [Effrenium voratum]